MFVRPWRTHLPGYSSLAQFDHAITKLLPHYSRSQPACTLSRHQKISCQLRTGHLRRLRYKRGECHDSNGNDYHASNHSEGASQKPVCPTQPYFFDCPADNPGDNASQKYDCQKNREKPSQVSNGL